MALSSLISTSPKKLPFGSTVNKLAKIAGVASEGIVIGLGSQSLWSSLRNLGIPFPQGQQFETIASSAVAYKIGGTAGVLGFLLASFIHINRRNSSSNRFSSSKPKNDRGLLKCLIQQFYFLKQQLL